MKIRINKPFHIIEESSFSGGHSGRVIMPAMCEAVHENNVVIINHPYGTFKITSERFHELIKDESIIINEANK